MVSGKHIWISWKIYWTYSTSDNHPQVWEVEEPNFPLGWKAPKRRSDQTSKFLTEAIKRSIWSKFKSNQISGTYLCSCTCTFTHKFHVHTVCVHILEAFLDSKCPCTGIHVVWTRTGTGTGTWAWAWALQWRWHWHRHRHRDHGMPATVDEATLLVFFDDIESTKQLFVFKILHLSDEATVSVINFKF
jgi:hypothetical protein